MCIVTGGLSERAWNLFVWGDEFPLAFRTVLLALKCERLISRHRRSSREANDAKR
jgi:hypothetical protein